jgi:hypothetical protein
MFRGLNPCILAALVASAASCGSAGQNVDPGGGAAGTDTSDGGACNEEPPLAPPSYPGGPPSAPGCYEFTEGSWHRIPCNCELPLRNTTHSDVEVGLVLRVSPADVEPSLSASPDIELHFDDESSAWFDAWSKQVGSGSSFSVKHTDSATTVRLGARDVTLDTVTLSACQSRMGMASLDGPDWATVDMSATLTDGAAKSSAQTGTCVKIPPP